MADKRFAVLIDSDNISARYVECILDEMTKYGVITYKRIYGDWTSQQSNKWKRELLENSITPIQQFSNTSGKNSTDSALIIDAMDILYTGNVDGFCIVSSDSDFTRLSSRLRESGMQVIGMGEEKTPRAFRAACNVFTNLEVLLSQNEEELIEEASFNKSVSTQSQSLKQDSDDNADSLENFENNRGIISEQVVASYMKSIIMENENRGKATSLGEIGNRLLKKYSDFDVRNYGYSFLSKFLEEMDSFDMIKEGNIITVKIRDNKLTKEELDDFIVACVAKTKTGIELGALGQKIHSHFNTFKVKDYGYSTFAKFIRSINCLEIRENKGGRKIVRCINK